MNLYEIAEEYLRLMYASTEEETTDALENIELDAEHKVEKIGFVIRGLEAQSKGLAAEASHLRNKKGIADRKIATLKEYAREGMATMGMERVEGHILTMTRTPSPTAVEVSDESLVPNEYKVATLKMRRDWIPEEMIEYIDKVTIDKKALIKTGEIVPGATFVRREHLRIK